MTVIRIDYQCLEDGWYGNETAPHRMRWLDAVIYLKDRWLLISRLCTDGKVFGNAFLLDRIQVSGPSIRPIIRNRPKRPLGVKSPRTLRPLGNMGLWDGEQSTIYCNSTFVRVCRLRWGVSGTPCHVGADTRKSVLQPVQIA